MFCWEWILQEITTHAAVDPLWPMWGDINSEATSDSSLWTIIIISKKSRKNKEEEKKKQAHANLKIEPRNQIGFFLFVFFTWWCYLLYISEWVWRDVSNHLVWSQFSVNLHSKCWYATRFLQLFLDHSMYFEAAEGGNLMRTRYVRGELTGRRREAVSV